MAGNKEEKVNFGFAKAHYATYNIENGIVKFDQPIELPGGVNIENESSGDPIEFYADNMIYYYADNNQGYDGKLTIARAPDSFRQDVLGEELDETDAVIMEFADAKTKPFALLFEFLNDIKGRRHVMYNCNAKRPNVNSTTKTNSTEPNTLELSYKATPLIINDRPMVKASTTDNTESAKYKGWFADVWIPKVAGGEG